MLRLEIKKMTQQYFSYFIQKINFKAEALGCAGTKYELNNFHYSHN